MIRWLSEGGAYVHGLDSLEGGDQTPCPCHKLDSAVPVVESAKYRECRDPAGPLDRAPEGRILVQGQMRTGLIVIGRTGLEDPA